MSDRNVVIPALYDFLKENETGLYTQEFEKNKQVYAYVHIPYYNVRDFVEIVGSHPFEEGGMDAKMFQDTLCVDINDIIESDGHYLSAYKKCFNEDDWKRYEDEIKIMEAD